MGISGLVPDSLTRQKSRLEVLIQTNYESKNLVVAAESLILELLCSRLIMLVNHRHDNPRLVFLLLLSFFGCSQPHHYQQLPTPSLFSLKWRWIRLVEQKRKGQSQLGLKLHRQQETNKRISKTRDPQRHPSHSTRTTWTHRWNRDEHEKESRIFTTTLVKQHTVLVQCWLDRRKSRSCWRYG